MDDAPVPTVGAALSEPLLAADEPPPFRVERADGSSPFVLTADHASRRLPRSLGSLGVAESELRRHIAWDIGIEALTLALAERLDAFAIVHNYSRLAIDVNRPPGTLDSIVTRSEHTEIPGNVALSAQAAESRVRTLFEPYHSRIRSELDRRASLNRPAVLVALHSFTPSYAGVARPWHVGVLYQRDTRLAHALLALLARESDLVVGDNEPYSVSDQTDYAVPVHGEQRGLLHVELEIRQDLLADDARCQHWAQRLARALEQAYARVSRVGRGEYVDTERAPKTRV